MAPQDPPRHLAKATAYQPPFFRSQRKGSHFTDLILIHWAGGGRRLVSVLSFYSTVHIPVPRTVFKKTEACLRLPGTLYSLLTMPRLLSSKNGSADMSLVSVRRQAYNNNNKGIFPFPNEYKEAVKDVMFLSHARLQNTAAVGAYKDLAAEEMIRQQLFQARQQKATGGSGATEASSLGRPKTPNIMTMTTDTNLNTISGLDPSLQQHFFPTATASATSTAQAMPIPIPAELPRNSKQPKQPLPFNKKRNKDTVLNKKKVPPPIIKDLVVKASKRRGNDMSERDPPPSPTSQEQRPSLLSSFDFGPLTACVSPSMSSVLSSPTTSNGCMPSMSARVVSPVSVPMPTDSSNNTRVSTLSAETRREIIKIKREVEQLKRRQASVGDDQATVTSASTNSSQAAGKINRELQELRRRTALTKSPENGGNKNRSSSTSSDKPKRVRFARPLVTLVKHRPRTRVADKEKLYFCPGELEELEWDRETTPSDCFECSIAPEDKHNSLVIVSVAHKLKSYNSQEEITDGAPSAMETTVQDAAIDSSVTLDIESENSSRTETE